MTQNIVETEQEEQQHQFEQKQNNGNIQKRQDIIDEALLFVSRVVDKKNESVVQHFSEVEADTSKQLAVTKMTENNVFDDDTLKLWVQV